MSRQITAGHHPSHNSVQAESVHSVVDNTIGPFEASLIRFLHLIKGAHLSAMSGSIGAAGLR